MRYLGNCAAMVLRISYNVPDMLVAPGLAWIKIADLFKKWRKYVPRILQDRIFPEPMPEMLEVIAERRRTKS